jgi:deazaflavin-dependent oxidoreductase (nitroreductase family)
VTSLDGEYVPSPTDWVRHQVAEYEASGGTRMNADPEGRLIVVLTSRGARSGNTRKNPVMRVEADGTYAVVASLGGAAENPQWFHNLVRHPRVVLQDGAGRHEYDARLVAGEERTLWWARAVAAYPTYADYQVSTDREIPIFVLERVS